MFLNKIGRLLMVVLSALVIASPGLAATASQMRPATKAEIEAHMGANAVGKVASNGFTYKAGSTKGYKVTNGRICIRYPAGNMNCAAITTDGSVFRMSTANGASASF